MATKALVGEDGGLIAGHARILAARQLGIAEIPVMARPLSAGHGL
jgi:ParB-like chromosome segregation protein Spo0J